MINLSNKVFLIAFTFLLACSSPYPQNRDSLKFESNQDELETIMDRMEVLLEKVSSSMSNEYEIRNDHLYIQYKDLGNLKSIYNLPNLRPIETREFLDLSTKKKLH